MLIPFDRCHCCVSRVSSIPVSRPMCEVEILHIRIVYARVSRERPNNCINACEAVSSWREAYATCKKLPQKAAELGSASPSKARRRSWLEGAGGGDRAGPGGASLSGGSMSNHSHKTPIQCNSHACSLNSVCCGLDPGDAKYYCASHCSCFNGTGLEMGVCLCDPGFHGIDCAQQISPTVWLAVILSVGTMLVLFLAWGFRCQDADFTDLEHDDHTRTRRAPLLREGADRVVAAARPPTTRETESPSSADVSCTGAGTSVETSLQRRTCCVCLSKPLQVVLIPCGHACLCRKCSRKLDKCPLCRLDIQATQRFYF